MTDDTPSPRPSPGALSRPLAWVIAWRFLRGRRSQLLNGTARAALAATALGVTAMVVAMALMSGYREGLQQRLIGGNAPLLAQPLLRSVPPLEPSTLDRLEELPGVEGVSRVAYAPVGSALVARGGGEDTLEVTLRGVDAAGDGAAGRRESGSSELAAAEAELAPPSGVPGAVLGQDLAERLGAGAGDPLRLVVLGIEGQRPRFRYQTVEVTGTFATGFAEFDQEWIVMDRELVVSLVGGDAYELYEFRLEDPALAPEVSREVEEVLGPDWLVTDWRELNRKLFTALRVQQVLLFLVLGLIVVVSTFNVASTLVVLVRERMRDIGVLGALGLAPERLRLSFLLYGVMLGVGGTFLGVVIGASLAWALDTFELIRFDAEVAAIYFIRSVPFQLRAVDLAAVVAFALGVNLLACWIPSWRAAAVDPARALRYE